jgi:hypothetical protein
MRPSSLIGVVISIATIVSAVGCDGGDDTSAPTTAHIETIAGGTIGDGGRATDAPLSAYMVATDPRGDIYLSDHARLRRIDAATGRIDTLAGGGTLEECALGNPPSPACIDVSGLAVDAGGRLLFFTEESAPRLRRLTLPAAPR